MGLIFNISYFLRIKFFFLFVLLFFSIILDEIIYFSVFFSNVSAIFVFFYELNSFYSFFWYFFNYFRRNNLFFCFFFNFYVYSLNYVFLLVFGVFFNFLKLFTKMKMHSLRKKRIEKKGTRIQFRDGENQLVLSISMLSIINNWRNKYFFLPSFSLLFLLSVKLKVHSLFTLYRFKKLEYSNLFKFKWRKVDLI